MTAYLRQHKCITFFKNCKLNPRRNFNYPWMKSSVCSSPFNHFSKQTDQHSGKKKKTELMNLFLPSLVESISLFHPVKFTKHTKKGKTFCCTSELKSAEMKHIFTYTSQSSSLVGSLSMPRPTFLYMSLLLDCACSGGIGMYWICKYRGTLCLYYRLTKICIWMSQQLYHITLLLLLLLLSLRWVLWITTCLIIVNNNVFIYQECHRVRREF